MNAKRTKLPVRATPVFSALMTTLVAMAPLSFADNRIPLAPGVTLTPTLSLTEAYDDNIFQANVAGDTTSWVTSVTPNVMLEVVQGLNNHRLQYSATTDFFKSHSQDENTDHHLSGTSVFAINRTNRIELGANYDRAETVSDTTVVGTNDKFENTSVSALYGFGTPNSPFAVDVGVNAGWFRSFNEGATNLSREYDRTGYKAVGYYLVSPKVRALLEYRHDEYDYLLSGAQLDSDKDVYLVGVTWSLTARTEGTLKFGTEDRNFDSSTRKDRDGSSWEANVNWQPSKRDLVVFNSFNGTRQGSLEEDFVDATSFGVSWNHQFSPKITSDLFYSTDDEDYENQIGRQDDVDTYGASINYDINEYFSVGASYRFQERDSSTPIRSFDRNVYLVNLNLSL
jgi:polysaccharide biosynthesis protein VpsM